MGIIDTMRSDLRRVCSAPIRPSAGLHAPFKVDTWEERATSFYLGHEEWLQLRRGDNTRVVSMDGKTAFGVPIYRVAEDRHYAVLYR